MNYEKTATEIMKKIGSAKNVADATHCFTRLRFSVYDANKVNLEQLKRIEGVIDARFQNSQLQVIIGNEVGKVYEQIQPYLNQVPQEKTAKHSLVDTIFTTIAAIFTPILPAIIGAGLMKGLLPLFVVLRLVSEGSDTYQVLTIIADTSFHFLPVLIAVSASRRFKVNEFLGVTLACSLLYPTIINGNGSLSLFNTIPIPLMSYASTVIPIILGVWVMSYVYHWVDRLIPNIVKMIFTPLIVLAIMIPLTLAIFGPIGYYVGQVLASLSLWLAETVPFLYGLLIGGLYPLIIMTGMHYAFFPIMLENISRLGYENGFLPISLFANMAMAAATLAVAIKIKNKQMKEISYSSAISAFFGITEPALYGVILKYKNVLYGVMITSGIVSGCMITLGVKMYAFLTPGILSLTVFMNPDGSMSNFMMAVAGVLVSSLIAFLITLFAKLPEKEAVGTASFSEKTSRQTNNKKPVPKIQAPVAGFIKPLEESSDPVFAEGMMGKGILLLPEEDYIVAPFAGTISVLMPEKHAIGLISEEGVELLIHIGIDTVELKGEGFETAVIAGDSVKAGQLLLTFNRQFIKGKGYATEIPVIVTNTTDYFEVIPLLTKKEVKAGDELLTIIY